MCQYACYPCYSSNRKGNTQKAINYMALVIVFRPGNKVTQFSIFILRIMIDIIIIVD